MIEVVTQSEQETRILARQFMQKASVPQCICLYGDLGSGKTTFTKGVAEALGLNPKEVKSPTYTYQRHYPLAKKRNLYHFDFYRLSEAEAESDDLMNYDLLEIFRKKNTWILIEWPERVAKLLPKKRMNIYFEYLSPTSRKISFNP